MNVKLLNTILNKQTNSLVYVDNQFEHAHRVSSAILAFCSPHWIKVPDVALYNLDTRDNAENLVNKTILAAFDENYIKIDDLTLATFGIYDQTYSDINPGSDLYKGNSYILKTNEVKLFFKVSGDTHELVQYEITKQYPNRVIIDVNYEEKQLHITWIEAVDENDVINPEDITNLSIMDLEEDNMACFIISYDTQDGPVRFTVSGDSGTIYWGDGNKDSIK